MPKPSIRPSPLLVAASTVSLMLAFLVAPSTATAGPDRRPHHPGKFRIDVASSPAHLVSGGDARLRVHVPARVDLDDIDLTTSDGNLTEFVQVPGEHVLEGVVSDLPQGDTTVTARVDKHDRGRGGRHTDVTLTNHPSSGPMFSGPQQEPFLCATTGDAAEADLPASTEEDCHIDRQVDFVYLSTTTDGFEPYDATAPPAAGEVATIVGSDQPAIYRWERGTINRFIYSIAIPASTDQAKQPTAYPEGWNRKLIYQFQGGVGIGHYQGDPSRDRMLQRYGLEHGYAVIYSTGTKTGVHYNLELGGETALMVKDRFVGSYGMPDYTVGIGGSGGAIQQYVYAQNHPGLIDAAIPVKSYPDMITQTIHVGDCELLERWMDFEVRVEGDETWEHWPNRSWLEGLNAVTAEANGVTNDLAELMPWMPPGSSECRNAWLGLSALALNPHYGTAPGITPEQQAAVEWTHFADLVNIYGVGEDGFANRTYDNVGVQYGLQALLDGNIDAAEFLDLNANVGSWKNEPEMVQEGCPYIEAACFQDVDIWSRRNMNLSPDGGDTPAPRVAADPGAIEAAFESGMVFTGDIDIPVIDWRYYLEPWLDMHNSHQSFAARQRMLDADRDASNQVVWFTEAPDGDADEEDSPQLAMAFEVVDEWMANIAANPGRSVAANKPPRAVDSCFGLTTRDPIASGEHVWDGILDDGPPGPCTEEFPVFSTSRIVAGAPITGDVFKCDLQPVRAAVARGVYGDWEASRADVERLREIFPDGVCDYRKDGARRPHRR